MNNLYIGDSKIHSENAATEGRFVVIDNEKFYEISGFDNMQPFFISLASDSNHWMFISSTGGLTAGRRSPDFALFPYYTDDKITDSSEITGSKSLFHVTFAGKSSLWEPFSVRNGSMYRLKRTIAKSVYGNKLLFSETNEDLGLTFSYMWMNSEEFGWVRKAMLINCDELDKAVFAVDGLQNILPYGIDRHTQNTFSTLVDAYKRTEILPESGVGIYRMESILVDRAEPGESLRANAVWCTGLENVHFLASSRQLNAFRMGTIPTAETGSKGIRGAYFACSDIRLQAFSQKIWYIVAEVGLDVAQITNLSLLLREETNLAERLEESVRKGTQAIIRIVNEADGIQHTADEHQDARHFSNVLFNCMRGGIFDDNYTINARFFFRHVKHFNHKCAARHQTLLLALPATISREQLREIVEQQDDPQLLRLFFEYLPLTFSRRHGDPSRPWNLFDINIKGENGERLLSYQGNWRDIFQNWEALSFSFPGYINAFISRFLNATTIDGYNPYKVTNGGFEWEVIEPENPWSNIGYWGDHQIVYLLKLLELAQRFSPESLQSLMKKDIFVYANVPYRLKSYREIVKNPGESIWFDDNLHQQIGRNTNMYGADARLVMSVSGDPLHVNFTEKILVTLLTKLSNFIPGAGIWMNTLRPEWNDANNALVGNGASMVTLYYMRRFVSFLSDIYSDYQSDNFILSLEVCRFFEAVSDILTNYSFVLQGNFSDTQRKQMVDLLGLAGEQYRTAAYIGFSGDKVSATRTQLQFFFERCIHFFDHTIACNKRSDHLYHSYNIIQFSSTGISVRFLHEMLEGQVAVLSSGKLSINESIALLCALRSSALYRIDQNSYMLYPEKELPSLMDKNNINPHSLQSIPLLKEMIDRGDYSIVNVDKQGIFHFNAAFRNVSFLRASLDGLTRGTTYNVDEEQVKAIEELYESMFDHKSFTGRSGTFYKYEGLGCIYWHMVSKLLLSIQEIIHNASVSNVEQELITELKKYYDDVKNGIGAHKSPEEYGSFPFDPYSHTPRMAGVQQPGMTGQVKEDIISRLGELGLDIKDGLISFDKGNVDKTHFINDRDSAFISFSFCSIPFEYRAGGGKSFLTLYIENEPTVHVDGLTLPPHWSRRIFMRDKTIQKVVVVF